MAKLDTAARKALPGADFAVPSKAPASGSYPIPDKSHARNALARASGKPVQGQVDAAVARKYPGLGKKDPPAKGASYSMGSGGVDRPTSGGKGYSMGAGGVDRPVGKSTAKPSPGRDMDGRGHMGDWADRIHPMPAK